MEVTKSYSSDEVEEKWLDSWDDSLYAYDEDSDAEEYVIDTPPPYPTGNLHIGNALGWCYMDYAARYKRLQGYNVLFPQGWDCHGLPTEVKVEEKHGIHKSEVPRAEFREMCVEHIHGMIEKMRDTMEILGFSMDWNHEYITMEPTYWGKTQRSFVEMSEKGYAYRDHHPVNWCPRCETAIADAEVEREDRDGELVYMEFPFTEGVGGIEIATTRPELLAACGAVAIHPDDERYQEHHGESVEVPLFGQEVEIITDRHVDSEFGTGAVMICTFGDKQDVEWWHEYGLELREAINRKGELTEIADEFHGLDVEEARDAIKDELEEEGYLYSRDAIEQNVGVCWRCDTPIEILAEEQWFIEVNQDEILEKAKEVEWIPSHAYDRLEDWATGMEWDWVISRQRIFATPFPVWYCGECGEPRIADIDELPIDPNEETPGESCENCGATDWSPEKDVMDTWMDSSISALHVAGWPEKEFNPTSLREQGHDIIRTWAFYTILRTAALVDEIPWRDALINGMVFGDDGYKMSKSRGNFVQPEEVVEEHGADAFRQAIASAGRPGSDIQFQWKEVDRATRFQTKLWNIHRFAAPHIHCSEYIHNPENPPELRLSDRWILSQLSRTISDVEAYMDSYRFDQALREIREFTWSQVADDYVELVKGRLYEETGEDYEAARWTLETILESVTTMLAPIAPFIAEEVYTDVTGESVHASSWPEVELVDYDAEESGDVQAGAVSSVRSWKSENGLALNEDIGRVEIYTDADLDVLDIGNALNAEIEIRRGEPELEEVPVAVEADMSVIGPRYKDAAGDIVNTLGDSNPERVVEQMQRNGSVELEVNGETLEIDGDALKVQYELRSGGLEVSIIDVEGADIVVFE